MMKSIWNEKEYVALLEKLVNIASPSGYTTDIMKTMITLLKKENRD